MIVPTGVQTFPVWALAHFRQTVVALPAHIREAPRASCDLVVLEATADAPVAGSSAGLMSEVSDCLRPGGTLMIVGENPRWFRNRRPGGSKSLYSMSCATVERTLRSIGYADVRRFYLAPSFANPSSVVPASVAATTWHTRFEAQNSAPHRARVLACRLGLHDRLYPSRMILATRC